VPLSESHIGVSSTRLLEHKACTFKYPQTELHSLDLIIDMGDLSNADRSWAHRRRNVLLARIYDPSPRYLTVGNRVGALTIKEKADMSVRTSVRNILATILHSQPT